MVFRFYVLNKLNANAPPTIKSYQIDAPFTEVIGFNIEEAVNEKFFKKHISELAATACAGNVRPGYVLEQYDNNKFFVLYGEETLHGRRNKRIFESHGFVMGRLIDNTEDDSLYGAAPQPANKGFYIDIICSKASGKPMLAYIDHVAASLGLSFIKLNALPTVLGYYPKRDFGFKFRKSCLPAAPIVPFEGTAFEAYLRTRPPLPKDSYEAYEIKEYMDFMKILHASYLNKKMKGNCNLGAGITKKDIKDGDCGEDGYTMMKCLVPAGGRRRTNRRRTNRRRTNRRRQTRRRA